MFGNRKYPLYEFGAPPFLNSLWISHSIKGRHHGESLFWQRIPAATRIINAILPIISAEVHKLVHLSGEVHKLVFSVFELSGEVHKLVHLSCSSKLGFRAFFCTSRLES